MAEMEVVPLLDGQVQITPVGLVLTGEISREQMERLGWQIGGMLNSLQFAAGDYLLECDRRFSHEADQLMDALGISLESRAQYRRVADAIPYNLRVDGISWSHHRAVAHLDSDQLTYYLNEAKREGWPKRVLEAELKKDLGPKPTKDLPAPQQPTPNPSVSMAWDTDADEVRKITLTYVDGRIVPFIPE